MRAVISRFSRTALHAGGREPSKAEVAQSYKDIVAIVGPKYTKKIHSNYFSNKRRGRINGRGEWWTWLKTSGVPVALLTP